jgi:hypothetical protein
MGCSAEKCWRCVCELWRMLPAFRIYHIVMWTLAAATSCTACAAMRGAKLGTYLTLA